MNSKPAELEKCMGPLWQPKLWGEINKEEYLKHTNCYSYAFNYIDYGEEKLQPGEIHGTKYKKTTCDEIIQKMKNDYVNDNVDKTSFEEVLSKDRYKVALFIDPDKQRKNTKDHDQDYHFYRQDKNGRFSHKQGTLQVENLDASGNAIWTPHLADRNYKKDKPDGISYTDFCSYVCVPNNAFKSTNAS